MPITTKKVVGVLCVFITPLQALPDTLTDLSKATIWKKYNRLIAETSGMHSKVRASVLGSRRGLEGQFYFRE
jgi:hypothetical protein